ncbi:hypothetical protein ACK1CN_25115 [Vibrio coralliilyticus]|uniref:hypothetical protein n=1 Tax=Vibrio coralliilyticus TaxID=190893 RepID=UPI0039173AE3
MKNKKKGNISLSPSMKSITKILTIILVLLSTAHYIGLQVSPALSETILTIRDLFEHSSAPTWFGSVGTVGTLLFLIIQNMQLIKENKKEHIHRRRYDDMLSFQMYQMHKSEFFECLSQLESKSLPDLKFTDKESLYRKFFPRNTFDYVTLESDFCLYALSELNDLLRDGKLFNSDIFLKLHNLTMAMNLVLKSSEQKRIGRVTLDFNELEVNIFQAKEILNQTNTVIKRIADFSRHKTLLNHDYPILNNFQVDWLIKKAINMRDPQLQISGLSTSDIKTPTAVENVWIANCRLQEIYGTWDRSNPFRENSIICVVEPDLFKLPKILKFSNDQDFRNEVISKFIDRIESVVARAPEQSYTYLLKTKSILESHLSS